MTTMSLGEEGFRWFVGKVEDRDDPLLLGRLKVRVYNLHSESQSRTSTDELPWAMVMNTVNNSNLDKVGVSPTGIRVGTTVVGFFMDGNDGNMPVIMGSLAGIPGNQATNHDVPFEARELNKVEKTTIGPEPDTSYAAKYPFNKVMRTEGGHVIEVDDTTGHERLHIFHKSGTYVEINQDGRMITKVNDDDFQIVANNREVYIKGNVNIQVDGNYTMNVTGDIVMNGRTINMNYGTMGAARIGDTADTGDDGTGSHFDTNAPGTNIIETGSGTVFIGD